MKLEDIAQTLLGAVFAVRVFDPAKPVWARVGYGLVAGDCFKSVLAPDPVETPALGYAKDTQASVLPKGSQPLKFQAVRVKTLQDRVAKVHEQMIAGTKDPKVYKLAREVLARRMGEGWAVAEKDHKAEAAALFNEVRKRVRYTWDPTDYDAFQTAARTLELHTGDCDDLTSLLGAMLRSVGHAVRSRVVWTKGSNTWNHIYLTVKIGNEWLPLDASVNKPAFWEVPRSWIIKQQDFDVVEGG